MKLFIGRLSYSTTNESLAAFFAPYGPLVSCKVIMDPAAGTSRGFGFVEIADEDSGRRAISELDGRSLDGREIVVSEARPQADRGSRSGGRDYRRGNSGGGAYSH